MFRHFLILFGVMLPFCSCAQSFAGTITPSASEPIISAANISPEIARLVLLSVPASEGGSAFAGANQSQVRLFGLILGSLGGDSFDGCELSELHLPGEASAPSISINAQTLGRAAQAGESHGAAVKPVSASVNNNTYRGFGNPIPAVEAFARLDVSSQVEQSSPCSMAFNGLHDENGATPDRPEPPVPCGGGEAVAMGIGSTTTSHDQLVGLPASLKAPDQDLKSEQSFSDIHSSPDRCASKLFRPPRPFA